MIDYLLKKQIVFSGFRDNVLKTNVEKVGGIVKNSMSKSIDILVVKETTTNTDKVKTAKKLNIKIMDKDSFIETFFKEKVNKNGIIYRKYKKDDKFYLEYDDIEVFGTLHKIYKYFTRDKTEPRKYKVSPICVTKNDKGSFGNIVVHYMSDLEDSLNFVAIKDGIVIGISKFEINSDTGYDPLEYDFIFMKLICVAESYRKQDIGRKLLDYSIKYLQKNTKIKLLLSRGDDTESSDRFLTNYGFIWYEPRNNEDYLVKYKVMTKAEKDKMIKQKYEEGESYYYYHKYEEYYAYFLDKSFEKDRIQGSYEEWK